MESFRDFQAGPDPFGRTYRVIFKWMQTGIALRGSDTVDCKFILAADDGERTEKVVALPHPSLLKLSEHTGRTLSDSWCCYLAAEHLRRMIETAEDIEKSIVTVPYEQLLEHDARLPHATARK